MACAGVGRDACVDDVGVGDQHHRAVPDAETLLGKDLADLKTRFTRIKSRSAGIRKILFVLYVRFCG